MRKRRAQGQQEQAQAETPEGAPEAKKDDEDIVDAEVVDEDEDKKTDR